MYDDDGYVRLHQVKGGSSCRLPVQYINFLCLFRGIGHLHSIMDLVITAKDIARAGEALCVMTQFVADQCPDSKSRNDLFAYMDRIKLHCHQLKITSAVRADNKTSTRETVRNNNPSPVYTTHTGPSLPMHPRLSVLFCSVVGGQC